MGGKCFDEAQTASQVESQSALLGPKLAALFFAAGMHGVNGVGGPFEPIIFLKWSYIYIYMSYPYKWPEIYGFHWG